jgi:hypothetical protein
MKNRSFVMLSSLTLLSAAAAFAQNGAALRADVPFDFRIGQKILPAGQYDVHSAAMGKALSIQRVDSKAGAVVLVHDVQAFKTPQKGSLVFNRYGDTYFLAKVWSPGDSQGRAIPQTKSEREFARNSSPAAPVQVAIAKP